MHKATRRNKREAYRLPHNCQGGVWMAVMILHGVYRIDESIFFFYFSHILLIVSLPHNLRTNPLVKMRINTSLVFGRFGIVFF